MSKYIAINNSEVLNTNETNVSVFLAWVTNIDDKQVKYRMTVYKTGKEYTLYRRKEQHACYNNIMPGKVYIVTSYVDSDGTWVWIHYNDVTRMVNQLLSSVVWKEEVPTLYMVARPAAIGSYDIACCCRCITDSKIDSVFEGLHNRN